MLRHQLYFMESGLTLCLISGIALILGMILYQKNKPLLQKGKRAQAVIFQNKLDRSVDFNETLSSSMMYYPIVKFTTDSNEQITQELSIGYYPAKAIGTKLEVVYDPDDPTNVEINSAFITKVLPALLITAGLIGFIVSILEYTEIINILDGQALSL